MSDRWVYCDVPQEVWGSPDALVCVVDRSRHYRGYVICCCQIKHLKELFENAKQRDIALDSGQKIPQCCNLIDDSKYMETIATLMPEMWKRIDGDGQEVDYECVLEEGVTKENFAECCKAYNRQKGYQCEFDEEDDAGETVEKTKDYWYRLPKDKLQKVIEDNGILSPALGSCEAGFPALRQYWEMLSPEDQKLDVDSLVECFDEDLKHLGAEMFETTIE